MDPSTLFADRLLDLQAKLELAVAVCSPDGSLAARSCLQVELARSACVRCAVIRCTQTKLGALATQHGRRSELSISWRELNPAPSQRGIGMQVAPLVDCHFR